MVRVRIDDQQRYRETFCARIRAKLANFVVQSNGVCRFEPESQCCEEGTFGFGPGWEESGKEILPLRRFDGVGDEEY